MVFCKPLPLKPANSCKLLPSTTKSKYILSDVQQASNELPVERTKSKKLHSKKFQGTEVRKSAKRKFDLTSSPQRVTGKKKYIFYGNFLLFLNVLRLLSFSQHKLFITFSSIGFQTMLLKRTTRFSIFLISFITSVSFFKI